MTLARRLAQVEAALTPTQLVLRWLDEAHRYGSLEAYVDSILDADPADFPLNRLAREATGGGERRWARREPPEAVRTALRQTVLRFELVLRINVRTHELLEREVLVQAVITGHGALLAAEPESARRDPGHRERLATSRDLALRRVVELHAAAQARAGAEARYLDGHGALFPEALAAWEAQVGESERSAVMAERLAELDGVPPAEFDPKASVAERVQALLADLLEPAKVTALEKLGETDRAGRIATNWVRERVAIRAERGLQGDA